MDNIVSWKQTLKGQCSKSFCSAVFFDFCSFFSFICCNNGGFYLTAPHAHSHLGTDQYHQCLMCLPHTRTDRLLQVCFSVFGLQSVWMRTLQWWTRWASGCKQDYWIFGRAPDVAALFGSDPSSPWCLLPWRTRPLCCFLLYHSEFRNFQPCLSTYLPFCLHPVHSLHLMVGNHVNRH